jgi:hypothetical protein
VRRPGPLVRGAALSLAILGAGCSFFASPGDYSAYRVTRIAPTFEERLAAAQRYLADHPDGAFRDDVRAYFDHAEEVYYTSKMGSVAGLEAYLAALPSGPHHEDAERKIGEMTAVARLRTAELDNVAAAVEARVVGPAAMARLAVRRELEAWLVRFLDPEVFRKRIAAGKASLVIPWSLSLPPLRCELLDPPQGPAARRCAKLFELAYEVDGPHGSEPREATFEITLLENEKGVPILVTLGGPDLFLRLEETYRVKPMSRDDDVQRTASAARVVSLVNRVFSSEVSAEDCARAVSPPLLLRLACEGVRADVVPAAAPGEDDRIVVAPLPR